MGDERPPTVLEDLREIASDFHRSRDLLIQLTLRDVRIRYKQAAMGFLWALLVPATVVLSAILMRTLIATVSGTPMPRDTIGAVALKSLPWTFFSGALGFATTSLTANGMLLTKVYFPREVLPVASTLAQLVDATVAALALALVLPWLGATASWALLWVPVLAVVLVLLTLAAALFLSCANVFFRDVKYLVQLGLTFGIFFTPVFWEPAMLGPTWAPIAMLNPLAPILEGLRLAVMEGHDLLRPLSDAAGVTVWSPWHLAYSAATAVIGGTIAILAFHRAELILAEHV